MALPSGDLCFCDVLCHVTGECCNDIEQIGCGECYY